MHKNSFFLIILFLIFIPTAIGVGIGQYSRDRTILFKPGLESTYKYYLHDAQFINANIEGDLTEYAVLRDANPGGGMRDVEVKLTCPDYLEPGEHYLYIVATESKPDGGATVGGIASVKTGFQVFALYPGIYPEFLSVSAVDTNLNEKTRLTLKVQNKGEDTIQAATGTITIYDMENKTVTTLMTDSKAVGPFEIQELSAALDTSQYNMPIGRYRIVGNLTSDGINSEYTRESEFLIGQLNVDIVDSQKSVIVNSTNKFYLVLESDWSGDITDVYAKIHLPNGKVLKTPNIDLLKPEEAGRKAAGQIDSYLETTDIPLGKYDIDVELFYKGKTKTQTIKMEVIDGKAPIIEKESSNIGSLMLIIGGCVIIVFVLLYFIVFAKKKAPAQGNSQPSEVKKQSSDEIRPPSL